MALHRQILQPDVGGGVGCDFHSTLCGAQVSTIMHRFNEDGYCELCGRREDDGAIDSRWREAQALKRAQKSIVSHPKPQNLYPR